MLGVIDKLTGLLGPARVLTGADVSQDDWHDESLVAHWHAPDVVVAVASYDPVALTTWSSVRLPDWNARCVKPVPGLPLGASA